MKQEIVLRSFGELSTISRVFEAEEIMKQHPNQLILETRHYFSPGIYARELFIPAGTLLTGQLHKYPQLNIMSYGEMSVLVDNNINRVKAPYTVVSPAGTKRIAYAHTDVIWTTILHTLETDPEKIEDHFIAKTEQEYLEFQKCLSLPSQ